MFEALRSIFQRPDSTLLSMEPQLAVAALLVHLSAIDGVVTPNERKVLEATLKGHYGLSDSEVRRLIEEATRQDQESVDFYRFTSALAALDDSEKRDIIRMMWQLVYADQKNNELEDNMVWRIAELIGVSNRDRTILRSEISPS
jgi:uncharacterized tellurite resistance protein B-like protein